MKIVEGESYMSTQEVRDEFDKASKKRFYDNIKPYLRVYHFDGRRLPWYSRNEVLALKNGKPIRKASIAITGMFSDWTQHARSLGFNITSEDRETKIECLPQDVAEAFSVTTDKQFIRKDQMSRVDGTPICAWSTWYPLELVEDILPQIKNGSFHNVVGYLASKGYPVSEVNDLYSSRITTFTEQALFQLLNDEPLIVLQRMARTPDKQVIALIQDMQLLGSWFVVKRSETIDYWNK